MVTLQAVLTLLVTVCVWSVPNITCVLKIVASKCYTENQSLFASDRLLYKDLQGLLRQLHRGFNQVR